MAWVVIAYGATMFASDIILDAILILSPPVVKILWIFRGFSTSVFFRLLGILFLGIPQCRRRTRSCFAVFRFVGAPLRRCCSRSIPFAWSILLARSISSWCAVGSRPFFNDGKIRTFFP